MGEEDIKDCPICGTDMDGDSDRCPTCGVTQKIIDLEKDMGYELNGDVDDIFDHLEHDLEDIEEHEVTSIIKQMSSIGYGEGEGSISRDVHESEEDDHRGELVFECPLCGTEVGENDSECPGCGAIFETGDEEEDIADEFERSFQEAKKKLANVRKLPLKVDIVKDLVRQATMAKNEEDYSRGLERAQEAVQVCNNIEEFLVIVKEVKEVIKERKEKDEEFKEPLKNILEAKEEVEKGKIKAGLDIAKNVQDFM